MGQVSRRSVARGAAWAAPAALVATTAPAYAGSAACADAGSDDLAGTIGGIVTGLWFQPSNLQADLIVGGANVAGDNRKSVRATSGVNYLVLHQLAHMHQGDALTLDIRFYARPVRNLTCTITNITGITGQWQSWVWTSPSPVVTARGPKVRGSGTFAHPFKPTADTVGTASSKFKSTDGDVTLTWPAATTDVRLTYVAGDAVNASTTGQYIGVGGFSYSSC